MLKGVNAELQCESLCLLALIGKAICFLCIWNHLGKMSLVFKETGLMRMEERGLQNNEMKFYKEGKGNEGRIVNREDCCCAVWTLDNPK